MRFEIYPSAEEAVYRGEQPFSGPRRWYWRLVAANGKIVADGSEGYASKHNARRAVRRVMAALEQGVGVTYVD